MWDFIAGIFKFWIDCFLLGISFGDHILLWTEIICGLFWLCYRKKGKEAMKTREDKIRNIAKWALISNRLFVEVEVPFTNEKRKLVMSDDFDPELPIPPHWDRNYSTNYDSNGGIYAYEVVNELTNPVLQVAYTAPNEVHVNGIFKVDENSILASFGQQPQLLTFSNRVFIGLMSTQRITTVSLQSQNFQETIEIYTNDSAGLIGQMFTNEFYRPVFPGQRAIFKYPSNRNNIGAFADWFMETNKSDTKTVDRPQ